MKPIILTLLLASPVAAQCHTHFCRVQKVAVVANVAHYVYPSLYAVPYQQAAYGSFADDYDKLTSAIETGVDRVLERRGIGALRANNGVSIVATKCGACHGPQSNNKAAREAWSFTDVPLSWRDAAKAQNGIVNHDMAARAKLSDAEQASLVSELTSYLTSAADDAAPKEQP